MNKITRWVLPWYPMSDMILPLDVIKQNYHSIMKALHLSRYHHIMKKEDMYYYFLFVDYRIARP